LLAQPVDRRIDVAVGLGERLLAVHHARAGQLAELLHQCGRNRRHLSPLRVETPGTPPGLALRIGSIRCAWNDAPAQASLRPLCCGSSKARQASGFSSAAVSSAGSTGASTEAPISTPSEPCWRAMPSIAALATRSQ